MYSMNPRQFLSHLLLVRLYRSISQGPASLVLARISAVGAVAPEVIMTDIEEVMAKVEARIEAVEAIIHLNREEVEVGHINQIIMNDDY